jgi:hypothetical protein
MDFFDERTSRFYEFLNETFDLKKNRSWKDISKSITLLKVKRTYRFFADIFPRKFDYASELKKCKEHFSTIHYSTLKGKSIVDEIVRFSLYSDKILVFHPLQNPETTNEAMNPGRNPKGWLPDFLEALYFYIVIQKWVASGIVKLIVNPYDYDIGIQAKLDPQIQERGNKLKLEKIDANDLDIVQSEIAEHLAVSYKNRDKAHIVQSILHLKNPIFTQNEAEHFADQIIKAFPNVNPLYEHLTIPLNTGMIVTSKGGGPVESILLLSEMTGGHIYTSRERSWEQIKEIGKNDFWTKVNQTFSKIPLTFLNNVDTSFALEIRKQDRLAGVRIEIKKIFSELSTIDIKDLTDSRYQELHDSFTEEIKKADEEWNQIQKMATTARTYWLTTNLGVPLVTNDVSIIPLILGSAAWLYQNETSHQQQKRLFRTAKPISMFIDLKNQKQTFFSELKNCLI